MKSLTNYVMELRPLYEFVIRVANCDMDQSQKEKIEAALAGYVVDKITPAKRLPIQEHAEFLNMGPCEVHVMEVTLRYPTITEQIRTVVAQVLNLSTAAVIVRTKLQEDQHEPTAVPKKAKDGSILNEPELTSESGQDLVGVRRLESMLKNLESRKYEFASSEKTNSQLSMPEGTHSPVGSQQNKIPSPVKGK